MAPTTTAKDGPTPVDTATSKFTGAAINNGPDAFQSVHQRARGKLTGAASNNGTDALQTVHQRAPITAQRPVTTNLSSLISEPGVPRAVECPSRDHPDGFGDNPKNYGTPLQQHVAFFDRNQDGIITPLETYEGFRKIGFNILFCIFAAFVIHFGLSYPSQDSWIPDPFIRIRVKNIHKCKHGSDMEGYDTEGRFVPQKMEEIFSKYDKDNDGHLTFTELLRATEASRNAMDIFGWIAAKFEWGTLWLLCSHGGKISREDVRSCYDGSLFYRREKEEKERLRARRQSSQK